MKIKTRCTISITFTYYRILYELASCIITRLNSIPSMLARRSHRRRAREPHRDPPPPPSPAVHAFSLASSFLSLDSALESASSSLFPLPLMACLLSSLFAFS